MNYSQFLEAKKHSIGNFGFEPNYIPEEEKLQTLNFES